MTDTPLRFYGPRPIDGSVGEVLYTVPDNVQKAFIRDLTFSNIGSSAVRVRASIGSISDPSKRIIDQDMPANTATFIRPLWLLDAAETIQGLQVAPSMATSIGSSVATVASGLDTTAYPTGNWTPAANTLYFLVVANGVASGTTALNPSSITGNGTWTLITGTTSTVAAAINGGVAAYWWFSELPGSSAGTTVNFASTQHSCAATVHAITSVYNGTAAVPPWTATATPIVQGAVAADTVAPGAGTASKTVTLAALQTGVTFYHAARFGLAGTMTPPSGYTEGQDDNLSDATGSLASIQGELSVVTTPPASSTTIGPATHTTSNTNSRAAIAWEVVPSSFVNCMVSGIEVR